MILLLYRSCSFDIALLMVSALFFLPLDFSLRFPLIINDYWILGGWVINHPLRIARFRCSLVRPLWDMLYG